MTRVLVGLAQTGFLVGLALIAVGVGAPTTPAERIIRGCTHDLTGATPSPCNRPATPAEQMQWQRDHLARAIEQQMARQLPPLANP